MHFLIRCIDQARGAVDLKAAKAFIEGDPYRKAGVWDVVSIDGFIKKTDNR